MMDVRGIGYRLGKQAAAAEGRSVWRTIKDLDAIRRNTVTLGLSDRLGFTNTAALGGTPVVDAAKKLQRGTLGVSSRIANGVAFGIPDRLGVTHSKQYQGNVYAAAELGGALGSFVIPGGLAVHGVRGVGYAVRGVGLLRALRAVRAAKGVRAATAVTSVARTAAPTARAAAPAARAGSAVGDWARFLSMAPVPRPTASLSYLLRTPSYMRELAKLPLAVPGVRPGLSALARTRVFRPVARGVRAVDNAYLRLAGTRPVQALSRVGNFVEGGGGRASKAFMAGDAAVGAYFGMPSALGYTQGIHNFDPQSEALGRALGYDSQFAANVSTTPGSFVPAARIQPPLVNTVPGLVNERRMRRWVDQYGRDMQAMTAEDTAASRELLSRRY